MKQWHWIILIIVFGLTVVGQFIDSHYWWEAVPGFFGAFGFAGCLLIIAVAKTLGGLLVSRKPGYYDQFKQQQQEDVKTDAH